MTNQQAAHRNWSLYNTAQTSEKLLALRIISDAVNSLKIPYIYQGNGRPSIGLDDMLKCCVIKVFNNFSSRRTMADIKFAYALKYIRQIPHFNSINNYMAKQELAYYLHKLYKTLALPLVDIEENFAVDATGFSTFQKKHWVELRLDRAAKKDFKKLHIICGVRTNIITSARVSEGNRSDMLYYEGMVLDTSENFRIRDLCADAGYLSKENCRIAEEVGASPFIMLKKNTRFFGYSARHAYAWQRMLTVWRDNKELFLQHYHQRSNVESTFSMMKRKFLPFVRSKTSKAQFNEILCKVVCHNASVLCLAMFELGVNLRFEE